MQWPSSRTVATREIGLSLSGPHFQRKLNPKGLPTQYALRPEPDPLVPVVDQGWGNPSFDEKLYESGRHDGANWADDNRKVFDFLKDKTFSTTAWHTIKTFERRGGGTLQSPCPRFAMSNRVCWQIGDCKSGANKSGSVSDFFRDSDGNRGHALVYTYKSG